MSEPTKIEKRTAHGGSANLGYHAVNPNGDLVLLPKNAPLKDGWRLATEEDIAAKGRAEHERRAREQRAAPPK